MATKHHESAEYKDLHKPVAKSTTGGQCMWGHKGGYSRGSCCYRWQAHKAAEQPAIKDKLHGYHAIVITRPLAGISTQAYATKKGGMYPAHYTSLLRLPREGDWDIDGPREDIKRDQFKSNSPVTIKKGKNFTRDTWPYWNNAHHLIPKGTLNQAIKTASEQEPRVATLGTQGLLRAGYNVNETFNMMILPMDQVVGELLQLPRHLGLETSADKFDHKGYNRTVDQELKAIVDEFVKAIKDADDGAPHPDFDAKITKDRLKELSEDLFDKIKDFSPGLPIDLIPAT